MEIWRKELRDWAEDCAARFQTRPGVIGVIIGGSLARGQEWRHSDLELGLLFEEKDLSLPYFNIDSGCGVEAIQLVRRDIEEQAAAVESGNWHPLLKWPIQLWRGRIVYDPSGLLGSFKRQFDAGLFQEEVLKQKVSDQQVKIVSALDEAQKLLEVGRPAAGLVRARWAMNDLILAFHWAHAELPRSQNRTDSRLRQICRRYDAPEFYVLYRNVFDLDGANRMIRSDWPAVREQVLAITRLWGKEAGDFFDFAVDSHFQWRQNAGILTVYRLYVPMIGGEEHGLIGKLDDLQWREANPKLVSFLGVGDVRTAGVEDLLGRIETAAGAVGRVVA